MLTRSQLHVGNLNTRSQLQDPNLRLHVTSSDTNSNNITTHYIYMYMLLYREEGYACNGSIELMEYLTTRCRRWSTYTKYLD